MEIEEALPIPPSALSSSLRVAAARERGVGAEQLRWIGTDPELFEALGISVSSTRRWRERLEERRRGEIPDATSVNFDPEAFRSDQTVMISGSPAPYDGDPEGGHEARFGIAEGEVEPCEPVPAP